MYLSNLKEYINEVGPRWYISKKLGSTNLEDDALAMSSSGPPTACSPLNGWRVKRLCHILHRGTFVEEDSNRREANDSCVHRETDFEPTHNIEMICLDGIALIYNHAFEE